MSTRKSFPTKRSDKLSKSSLHSRKINLWQYAVIVSPFVGPLFAAFMVIDLAWYWPFIIYTIETAICLALVIFFVEETYYDRKIPEEQQPPHGSRLMRLIGVQQRRNRQPSNTFLEAMMRPIKAISKPVILLTNVYYLLTFAWSVGINATLAQLVAPLYGFGPKQIGRFLVSHTYHFVASFEYSCSPKGV